MQVSASVYFVGKKHAATAVSNLAWKTSCKKVFATVTHSRGDIESAFFPFH